MFRSNSIQEHINFITNERLYLLREMNKLWFGFLSWLIHTLKSFGIFLLRLAFILLSGSSVNAQSNTEMQINMANDVRRMVVEGIARADAHVKDMKEIGERYWKARFDKIFDATYKCEHSTPDVNYSKEFYSKMYSVVRAEVERISDEIEAESNSVDRLIEIYGNSATSACYQGFERNLGAYMDCAKARYKKSVALSSQMGIAAMLSQFEIFKNQAYKYTVCFDKNRSIIDSDMRTVAETIDDAGKFYIDMARRFSREAAAAGI